MNKDNEQALLCADVANIAGLRTVANLIRRLVAENEDLKADRDSWADQASERLKDWEDYESDNASLRRINESQDALLAKQDKLLRYAVNVISNTLIQSDRLHSMTLEQLEQCRSEIRQHLESKQ